MQGQTKQQTRNMSSSDEEPLLANFLSRHTAAAARRSDSSNSSLPEWIKTHQVRTGCTGCEACMYSVPAGPVAAGGCSAAQRARHGAARPQPARPARPLQTPQKAGPSASSSSHGGAKDASAPATQQQGGPDPSFARVPALTALPWRLDLSTPERGAPLKAIAMSPQR